MSRRFKKSRSQKVKRSVNIVLLTIYLLLVGFLLFLIFKYNILAFRHVNIAAITATIKAKTATTILTCLKASILYLKIKNNKKPTNNK